MKTAKLVGSTVIVRFGYKPRLVSLLRTMVGRKFHKRPEGDHYWTVDNHPDNVIRLDKAGFKMKGFGVKPKRTKEPLAPKIELPKLTKEVAKGLRPFQCQGIQQIDGFKGRCLLADEMGLGKTVQALRWLLFRKETALPAVVVCPASLKANWKRETSRWAHGWDVKRLATRKGHRLKHRDMYIVNYDVLKAWVPFLKEHGYNSVLIDECHYIKKRGSQRAQAVRRLAVKANHLIAISGTPVLNRPEEIWRTLNLLDWKRWPSFWSFANQYCGLRFNSYYGKWDASDATNTEKLNRKLLRTCMIRRLKKDVLKELPPKTISRVSLEIDNRKEYNEVKDDFIQWALKNGHDKAAANPSLSRITYLLKTAMEGKQAMVINWVDQFLASGEPLVIGAYHHAMIDALMGKFGKVAVKLDGSCDLKARDQAVQSFQSGKAQLFVGQIKAAGVGLTLARASHLAIAELTWVPSDLAQFEDRVHRIGQQNAVNVYYLIAERTIEQYLLEVIEEKKKVIASVVDGKQELDEKSMIKLVVQRMKEKES